jgi:uncharacterized membrane protein
LWRKLDDDSDSPGWLVKFTNEDYEITPLRVVPAG